MSEWVRERSVEEMGKERGGREAEGAFTVRRVRWRNLETVGGGGVVRFIRGKGGGKKREEGFC